MKPWLMGCTSPSS
jgi:transposase InsO family protein